MEQKIVLSKQDKLLAKSMHAFGAARIIKNKRNLVFWNKDTGMQRLPNDSFSSLKKNQEIFIDEIFFDEPFAIEVKEEFSSWDADDIFLAYALHSYGVNKVSRGIRNFSVAWHRGEERGYLPEIAFEHLKRGESISLDSMF